MGQQCSVSTRVHKLTAARLAWRFASISLMRCRSRTYLHVEKLTHGTRSDATTPAWLVLSLNQRAAPQMKLAPEMICQPLQRKGQ